MALVGAGGTDHEGIHMHCFAGIAGRNREGVVAAGAGAHTFAYGVFQGGTVGAHIHAVGQRRAAVQIPQFVFAITLKI